MTMIYRTGYYCDQCGALLPPPPHTGAHNCPGFNAERAASGMHCSTCQCNKIHPTPPVPGNTMSKSWHDNTQELK